MNSGRRLAVLALFGAVTALPTGFARAATAADPGKQSYLDAADKICKASNDRLLAAATKYETSLMIYRKGARTSHNKVSRPSGVAMFLKETALPEFGNEIDQLAILVPPKSERVAVDGFLTEARKVLAATGKDPKSAAYRDPFDKLSKSMAEYGYTECFSRRSNNAK